MTFFHAVLKIDRSAAKIVHFDREQTRVATLLEKVVHTHQHHRGVRQGRDFLGAVCDALAGTAEILVVGPHGAHADFHRYVDTYRPALIQHIVAWKTVNHPNEAQLVALARRYFAEHEREADLPPAI